MLWFERQVVRALSQDADPGQLAAIESYVDGALGALPEHIRLGVAAESVALGGWSRLDSLRHRAADGGAALPRLGPLESSPIGPVRQYVRLIRSLVIFAQHEQPEPSA
jgi:hypothetical protein